MQDHKAFGGRWLDTLAIGASLACLIHCVGLPILFALLPALSRLIDVPEAFHLGAFLFAIPASAWAMRTGYENHGAMLPAALGATGLAMLGVGALAGLAVAAETGLTVLGSLVLTFAHFRNWALRRR